MEHNMPNVRRRDSILCMPAISLFMFAERFSWFERDPSRQQCNDFGILPSESVIIQTPVANLIQDRKYLILLSIVCSSGFLSMVCHACSVYLRHCWSKLHANDRTYSRNPTARRSEAGSALRRERALVRGATSSTVSDTAPKSSSTRPRRR